MTTPRSATLRTRSTPPAATSTGVVATWLRFWFTPTDPIGLHIVRILSGLVFLAWLLPFASDLDSLFSQQGWFDLQAYADAARLEGGSTEMGGDSLLPFGWSVLYWISSSQLAIFYWSVILVVLLHTLGVFTRLTSVLTWVAMVSFTANPILESDGDVLIRLLAMYVMVGYVLLDQWEHGQTVWSRLLGSRDALLLGRSSAQPSIGANVAMRLLQVHVVIVVLTSALHKLQFGEWWSGLALWYPIYSQSTFVDIRKLAPARNFYLGMYSLATYLVLAWQFAFPFFAWRPRWRMLLLGGSALAWLANLWLYQVPNFGSAFAVCGLSFVTPAEWRQVLSLVSRLPGLSVLARTLPNVHDRLPEKKGKKKTAASLITAGQR